MALEFRMQLRIILRFRNSAISLKIWTKRKKTKTNRNWSPSKKSRIIHFKVVASDSLRLLEEQYKHAVTTLFRLNCLVRQKNKGRRVAVVLRVGLVFRISNTNGVKEVH